MGTRTGISWTDATWNPWQGCHKVSQGCKNCYMYAEKTRYGQQPATVLRSQPHTFNMPLRLKDPQRVFTCSWSDFFLEEADPWRDEAFAIMALTPHLTYQVLTKRPEQMYEYLMGKYDDLTDRAHAIGATIGDYFGRPGLRAIGEPLINRAHGFAPDDESWEAPQGDQTLLPLPNVWLGVSVEDQATADTRIPWLLQTPAAVRFVSYEPALGPVDFTHTRLPSGSTCSPLHVQEGHYPLSRFVGPLHWIICGGEGGHNARPCNLEWLRSTIQQCQAAGVACWVKQLGARPLVEGGTAYLLKDRKGADPAEWPEDLRVQAFPANVLESAQEAIP